MTCSRAEIATVILELAAERGAGRTFCPSEAARRLAQDWRPMMPAVREEAGRLRREGRIAVTQKGHDTDPETARGPIRLGLPASGSACDGSVP